VIFTSAAQLKDKLKNKSKDTGTHATELLQNYMLERFLERMSRSSYHENMILKGGFLIAAMVGVNKRSTMDIDTTTKGLPVNREGVEKIIREIISVDVDDGVTFEVIDIKNIHGVNEYDDFRISFLARLFTLRVNMSIDITTGDTIIPSEVVYNYKLMFEDRTIPVMAYNLISILAEKIETIIVRGVGNTRGRDYYDVYLLLSLNRDTIKRAELLRAIKIKADERESVRAIENHSKILNDIAASPDIAKIWNSYTKKYHYAEGIALSDILALIAWVFVDYEAF